MSDPTPARKPAHNVTAIQSAMERLAMANDAPPVRQFAPPALPPGVGPASGQPPVAMDSNYAFLNQQAGMPGGFCGMAFPGYPYLSNLAQRSEYRAPVETISDEMTREFIKLQGTDDKKLSELQEAMEEFHVRDMLRQTLEIDGFFGVGHLFINIKGQDKPASLRRPLMIEDDGATIGKGCLLGFKPIEPYWMTPYAYNSNDPTRDDFYVPEQWYIMSKQTHASRVITIVSHPVPDALKPSYNFGGLSLSQLIESYVNRWLKTVDSVATLVSNFSKTVIATDMQAVLEDGDGAQGFIKRMQLFTQTSNNRGIMAVNKGTEEILQVNTPLSGLAELQAQAQEHMAAPTHIPLVKLTGITPSGLNASSEGEIKVFYDFIAAQQENQLNTPVRTILRILQLHLWGKVDPDITFEWVPLDSPTDKELSEMRKSDGDRDTAYVGAGIVSADEVRDRLRGDPNSGYTGLEGNAPEAPELTGAEHGAELDEEGKQADHERGEESAENAHARAKDLAKTEAKLTPAAKKK